jgi:short subunit dehydrogenase-like uncharacterized protein
MARGSKKVMVYGCNGYTAGLLLPRLASLDLDVIVAGRCSEAVARIGGEFGWEHRVFHLTDASRVDDALGDVDVMLNAAGPFAETAPPLIDACLRRRVDYLDLSGELEPLAYALTCDAFGRSQGVMLLPAVGFDVVPSDCLAVYLSERLPSGNALTLSISASNLLSRGSAVTFAANAGAWVQVRRAGVLEPMRFRTQTRFVDFGQGERPTIAVSWGDLVTAFHSTGISNIEVYFEATAFRWLAVTTNQLFGWALRAPATKSWFDAMARAIPGGPPEAARAREQSVIVGELSDGERRSRVRLITPEAYTFTAEIAAQVVLQVASGNRRSGFHTPGRLFGPDFVLGVPGVTREVLE